MASVSAKKAQEDFLELLDAVELGEDVVVERQGRQFRLSLVSTQLPAERSRSPRLTADPEVLTGDWTWVSNDEGQLCFRARGGKP